MEKFAAREERDVEMSSTLAYKCDGCGKGMAWEDSAGLVGIHVKQRGPYPYNETTLVYRDYCAECWKLREAHIVEATKP